MLPTMKVDVNEISKKLVHKLVRRQKVYTDTPHVWHSEFS